MFLKFRHLLLVVAFYLVFPQVSFSQVHSVHKILDKKIGVGGFIYPDQLYLINISYNKILSNFNELKFPVYYYNFENENEISGGLAYNYAIIKKSTRFNFYIGPELNLNYFWKPDQNSNETVSRYGSFLLLDLAPSYKISPRITTAFEISLGWGYQWSTKEDLVYSRLLLGLKVYYCF